MRKNKTAGRLLHTIMICLNCCILLMICACGSTRTKETGPETGSEIGSETVPLAGSESITDAPSEVTSSEAAPAESVQEEALQEKAASQVQVISPEDALTLMDREEDFLLLDVREEYEYEAGYIPGAVCIPYTELEARQAELPEEKELTILVYCRSGRRSAIAAETLAGLGYQSVLDLGGIIDWPYEVVSDVSESEHEHQWEDYDCNYEVCTICGKYRHY